jgi:hypothetical protein
MVQVKDGKLGFVRARDGWHSLEIGDEINFRKVRDKEGNETDEVSDSLTIPCKVIEDEDEGCFAMISLPLNKPSGKNWLGTLMFYTGYSAKVAKKKKWPDLNSEKAGEVWKDEFFEPDHPMVQEVISKLPGYKFDGLLKTQESQRKGEDGTPIAFQNIIEVDFYKKRRGSKVVGTPSEPAETTETEPNDDDAW